MEKLSELTYSIRTCLFYWQDIVILGWQLRIDLIMWRTQRSELTNLSQLLDSWLIFTFHNLHDHHLTLQRGHWEYLSCLTYSLLKEKWWLQKKAFPTITSSLTMFSHTGSQGKRWNFFRICIHVHIRVFSDIV